MAETVYNLITGAEVVIADWQRDLCAGDYYIIESPMMAIVAGDTVRVYTDDDARRNPPVYGRLLDNQGLESGYWWVLAFSQTCPYGEKGGFHISEATRKLTPEEFSAAQMRKWTP